MKAIRYHGPKHLRMEEVPAPGIQEPTDAVVRIRTATICGTDLHILKGDVPEVRPGTILGHEAVAVIEEVGAGVRRFRPGDRVLVPAITACGLCAYCRRQMYGQCEGAVGGSSATSSTACRRSGRVYPSRTQVSILCQGSWRTRTSSS